MLNPAQELVGSIADKVRLPEVYLSIRELIARPESTIDDYVIIVNSDPALATRIMRIANSAFFGYINSSAVGHVTKAETVKQAISYIGVMQLHDLLLSSLGIRAFSGIPGEILNQDMYWRSSVLCGITARLLARKCTLPASERMFTSGLLQDVGHLIMYAKIPEQVQDIYLESDQFDRPLEVVEREQLGFDYVQVGSELMRFWRLPESYQAILTRYPEQEKITNLRLEMCIINFARRLVLAEDSSVEASENVLQDIPEILLKAGLATEDLEEIVLLGQFYVDDVMDILWPFSRVEKKFQIN